MVFCLCQSFDYAGYVIAFFFLFLGQHRYFQNVGLLTNRAPFSRHKLCLINIYYSRIYSIIFYISYKIQISHESKRNERTTYTCAHFFLIKTKESARSKAFAIPYEREVIYSLILRLLLIKYFIFKLILFKFSSIVNQNINAYIQIFLKVYSH